MAGNVSSPGATVTSRALALVGAFDEEHRRLTLTELAQRAGLPVPTAHRLVGELVGVGRARPHLGRRLRDRPAALGPRPARPAPGRARRARLAVPPRPLRRDPGHRAPGRARGHRGAVRRPAARQHVGADRQHRRHPAADARHRGRQGAAGASRRPRCSVPSSPTCPASRRTRSPSRAPCSASSPRCGATTTRPPSRR